MDHTDRKQLVAAILAVSKPLDETQAYLAYRRILGLLQVHGDSALIPGAPTRDLTRRPSSATPFRPESGELQCCGPDRLMLGERLR